MPIPRFYRSLSPTFRPREAAGVEGRAQAQFGSAVAGAGAALSNWADRRQYRSDVLAASRGARELETWQYSYLRQLNERRAELGVASVDPETGDGRTGYELEVKAWPDRMRGEYERIRGTLSPRAAEMLELQYHQSAPHWSRQTVEILDRMELEDVTAEIGELAQEDRASEALDLLDLYGDRYSPADRQKIEAGIAPASERARLAAVQVYLRGVAKDGGWDAAAQIIHSAEFQETWGLDLQHSAQLRQQVEGFLQDERALEEKIRRDTLEKNNDGVLADAWQGKTEILAQLPGRIRRNEIDADVAAQAKAILTAPPAANAPDTLEKLLDLQDTVARDPSKAGELKAFARAHASELTKETYENALKLGTGGYSAQMTALNDEVQQARAELVTVSEQDILSLLQMGGAVKPAQNERARQVRAVDYVRRSLLDYLGSNPKATADDLYRQRLVLLRGLRRQNATEIESLLEAYEAHQSYPKIAPGSMPEVGDIWPPGSAGALPTAEQAQGIEQAGVDLLTTGVALGLGLDRAPLGLESVWGTCTAEEKKDILQYLASGGSVEKVLEKARQ